MPLLLITPPESEPLTAIQARARVKTLESISDDTVVLALIAAARGQVELDIGRSILTQTWELSVDHFDPQTHHAGGAGGWAGLGLYGFPIGLGSEWGSGHGVRCRRPGLELPMPPLQAVTAVTYLDAQGVEQTLDAATYLVIKGTPAHLVRAPGKTWPRTMNVPGAVRVTFTAGYSDDGDDVPENIRYAIVLQAGHLAALLGKDPYVSHEQVGQLSRSFRVNEGPGTAITAAAQALLKDLKVFS